MHSVFTSVIISISISESVALSLTSFHLLRSVVIVPRFVMAYYETTERTNERTIKEQFSTLDICYMVHIRLSQSSL